MSPRVIPKHQRSARAIPKHERELNDLQVQRIVDEQRVIETKAALKVTLRDHDPYGSGSEHSWILDSAAAAAEIPDPRAEERLKRSLSANEGREERAVGTSALGGLVPSQIAPWVAQAVAYGVRSGAPLALALERLDLPPVGMSASWAKVTTPATIAAGSQSAENASLTASADVVVGSVSDGLKTIASYLDFSSQAFELSGGWLDRVLGEELGRAFAARLEQQVWNGQGGAQLTGFAVMSGSSSSSVSTQSMAGVMSKVSDQFRGRRLAGRADEPNACRRGHGRARPPRSYPARRP
jgi:HK97 family phage major capsid protein